MNPLTTTERAAIRARCGAGTKPSWHVDDSGNIFGPGGRLVANCAGWSNNREPSRKENMANAALIVHARNEDIPRLLYDVDRLIARAKQSCVDPAFAKALVDWAGEGTIKQLKADVERLETQLRRGVAHARERVALIVENKRLTAEVATLRAAASAWATEENESW